MAKGKKARPPKAKAPPAKRAPDPTQAELAAELKVTTRQVRNLLAAGMPGSDVEAAREWKKNREIEAEVKKRTPRPATAAKLREQELKNALLEIELAEKKKEMLHATLVRPGMRALAMRYAGAVRSLLQHGGELLGITDPADMQLALERITNRMLAIGRGDEPEQLEMDPAPKTPAAA